VGALYHKM